MIGWQGDRWNLCTNDSPTIEFGKLEYLYTLKC